jgi:hypothetical protein
MWKLGMETYKSCGSNIPGMVVALLRVQKEVGFCL